MKHIKVEIKGKFTKYAELTAESGYCFYDVEEERNYITKISTPVIDEKKIEWKYIVVKGNAEELNKQLEKEKENG